MNSYESIEKMLRENSDLALRINFYKTSKIAFSDWEPGILNFRTAELYESDPRAGQVINPWDGLDQQFVYGPRRSKKGYSLKGRDTLEALNLLEKVCKGEKGIQDKVQGDGEGKRPINGYDSPKPGIDTWVFGGFEFLIHKNNKGELVLKKGRNILKEDSGKYLKIESIKEAISIYEETKIDSSMVKFIAQGNFLNNPFFEGVKLGEINGNLSEFAKGIVTKEFLEKYNLVLKNLEVFGLSKEDKINLFPAMLLGDIYFKK